MLGAVCGESAGVGVRGRAVWASWFGGRQVLRQREDRAMSGDISGDCKAIG